MSAITAKASRKMKKYAVLTREPRCFLGSFDFSWEQREVGDLLIERSQQAPMSDEYPLMAFIANEGVAPKGERYDRSALVTDTVNKLYKKTEKGDFIYSSNNLETGSIGLNKYGKACISPVYSIFEPTGIADSDFLGRRLVRKDFINAMVKWRQGVIYGQWRIHESDFLKIEISVPSVEEQRKIGAYLDQLDNLITLHQRQPFLQSPPDISLIVQLTPPFYTFSWEQRKLGDIADIVGGGTPSTGNQSYWDGDIDWYAPAEIADQIYANSSQKKITGLGYENSSAKMLPPGTVLFTSRAGIGKTAILTRKGCTNQGFQSIVPHRGELDSYFIFSRTEELKRYGELVGAGSTFVEVSGKQMAVMELMMPPTMREQQTIGGFFQQLDHLITLHQRQPFLQSPPDISLIVQLTPPFYTFSWEQRKFDEVFDCTVPNNTLSRAELSYDEGTVLNVHYGDVLIKYGSVLDVQKDDIPRIPHRCREDFNGALLQDGDVIIADTAEDETTGKACEIGNLQGSAIVSGLHTMVCRPRNRMALGYLGYYLNSNAYHHQLLPLMQGIKVLSLSRSNIQKTSVSYPIAVKEQQLIAYYFSQLDNLITLHQRQTIVYAVIRSIRKVILAERQYFAPPMVRKSP